MARHRQGPSVRLRKRGEYFWVYWTKPDGSGSDGESLATKCPVEAETEYAKFLLRHGKPVTTRPDKVPIDECLARYWLDVGQELPSAEQCKGAIKHLDPHINGLAVADINSNLIKEIGLTWREKRGNRDDTISRKLSVLRAALNYNVREKFLDEAPFIADLPKAPSKNRVLSLEEMAAVWRCIPAARPYMQRYFLT